jgi:hypothetical protein
VDPLPFFIFILPFTFTRIIYFLANNYLLPHDTFNPLFTANRWNWQPHCKLGQSTLVVLCAGFTLLLLQSYTPDKAPYINCLELSLGQLASTFGSWFFLLLVRLNHDFILREDLLLCSSYLPLGVPNWVPNMHYQKYHLKDVVPHTYHRQHIKTHNAVTYRPSLSRWWSKNILDGEEIRFLGKGTLI